MPRAAAVNSKIDELMERASAALVATEYFDAAALCVKALNAARRLDDFERIARICLPLQEARRQIRGQAEDAGCVTVLNELPRGKAAPRPGGFLLEPPLVGVDARTVRDVLTHRRIPALVLTREPATRAGKWPIVGVGTGQFAPVVVRVQVEPPGADGPTMSWMAAAQEALGDAAIAQVRPEWPADHRVDDLLERLEAVPDHEKLIQSLEAACREAAMLETLSPPRRRSPLDDPYGF